jgi:hypothetical protein
MMKTATRQYLRVQLYGKNYTTNKYSNYFGEFDPCPPPPAAGRNLSPRKASFKVTE